MQIFRTTVFLFALIIASAFAAPTVKLEYAFNVGDTYVLTQRTQQTIKQTIMGTEQSGESAYNGEMKFKVVSRTATGAKLETEFLKLNSKSKTMIGETIMDSEGPQDTMENKLMKAMMNKTFYVLVNKRGGVEAIEGAENIWSGIGSLGLDEEKTAAMKQMLNQYFSEASLKSSFEQALVYYADKKVKQGEAWTSQNSFPLDFPIKTDNTWKLASINGPSAKVNAEGIYMTTDKDKEISLPGGFKAKVDLGGKQTINSNVNVKSGWPTDLAISSLLKGKMLLLAGGMLPTDLDVPMEISTQTTFTFSKK